ncbi:MAG: hypothetical protein PHD72_04060 [Patescibacteria group bacterium]|nr:hypothetical protein [Patescibacteria group bacterium]
MGKSNKTNGRDEDKLTGRDRGGSAPDVTVIEKRKKLEAEFSAAREAIKKHAEAVRAQGEAVYAKHHQNLEKQLQELDRLSGDLQAISLDNTKAANQVKVFNFERDLKAAKAKADKLLASIEAEIAGAKPEVAPESKSAPAEKPAEPAVVEPPPAPAYVENLDAVAKTTAEESAEQAPISPANVAKIVAFFEEMATDGETGGYARMADNLRARAPNGEFEPATVKEQRKKIIDHIFQLNLKDALKHLKFIVEQGSLDNVAKVGSAEAEEKWDKRRKMLEELKPLLGVKEKGSFSPEIKVKKDSLQKLVDDLNNTAVWSQREAAKYSDEDKKLSKIYTDKIKSLTEGGIRDLVQTMNRVVSDDDYEKVADTITEQVGTLDKSLSQVLAEFEERKTKGASGKKIRNDKQPPPEKLTVKKEDEGNKKLSEPIKNITEPAEPQAIEKWVPPVEAIVKVEKPVETIVKVEKTADIPVEETPYRADIMADLDKIINEVERTSVKIEASATPAESPVPATSETLTPEINPEVLSELRKKKEELEEKLVAAREKLKLAFANKEKASGFFNRAKTRETANAEFDAAWNEYTAVQQDLVETCRLEAEELRGFLHQESAMLQSKLGEYYKGKEHVVSKVWRRLGEMNLYNFLEKKGAEVAAKEEQGEPVVAWDRFWADRSNELKNSHALYKMGAKMLSVRLGISMGLLGAGLGGIPGAALSRGAFVGLGAAFGSRHLEDAAQNKMQRWLGNRGEFYGTSEEAEAAMRDKYRIVEQTFDEDAPTNEKEEKKAARRQAKYEKKLGNVEADIKEFRALPPAGKLSKIQEKISAIEAYAYVNGLNLSKDKNYQRLLAARDRTTEEFLSAQAKEAGDDRPVIRPDDLEDMKALLANRKAELSRTAEKISSEKKLRWGKRIVAATLGVAVGSISYLATLRNAELFQHGQRGPVATFAREPAAGLTFAREPAAGLVAENGQAGFAAELEQLGLTHGAVSKLTAGSLAPEELASVEKFAVATGAKREAMQAYSHALATGHSPEDIYDSMMVHKGDGLERVLQRQLRLDPTAYGYKGDLNDVAAVKKWVGHQASVLAQEQDLDDKYFVYKPNEEQMAIISVDEQGKSHVDILGKLYHERPKIAALATPDAPSGEPIEVKAVYDIKTGGPKFLTDAEQAEYQILTNRGEFDDAMAVVIEAKEHGPVFELPDGHEVHGDALSFGEATPVAETAVTAGGKSLNEMQQAYVQGLTEGAGDVSTDTKPELNELQKTFQEGVKEGAASKPSAVEAPGKDGLNELQRAFVEGATAGDNEEENALAEYMAEQKKALALAEKHHLLPETDALGPDHPEYKTSLMTAKFSYGEQGEVKGVDIKLEHRFLGNRAEYERALKETYLADKNTVFKDKFTQANFDMLATKAEAHHAMIKNGLGNTREAQYLFKDIRHDAFELADESGKSPEELFRWKFNEDYKIKY